MWQTIQWNYWTHFPLLTILLILLYQYDALMKSCNLSPVIYFFGIKSSNACNGKRYNKLSPNVLQKKKHIKNKSAGVVWKIATGELRHWQQHTTAHKWQYREFSSFLTPLNSNKLKKCGGWRTGPCALCNTFSHLNYIIGWLPNTPKTTKTTILFTAPGWWFNHVTIVMWPFFCFVFLIFCHPNSSFALLQ